MAIWIVVAGAIAIAFIAFRLLSSRSARIEGGEVSQSWIVEHRADNQRDQ